MSRSLILLLGLLGACGAPDDKMAPPLSSDESPTDGDIPIRPECGTDENILELVWPLGGEDARDWVVVNYVDLDNGPEMLDWSGNIGDFAKTYDGHLGIDIGLSSFRIMDEGVPILAAAPGTVEYVIDGYEDRHTSCVDSNANIVGVRHPTGHLLHYVHMRTDSTTVQVGDRVAVGDVLGEVGSSGCSSGPHLHFEITAPYGEAVSPFLDGLWCDAPGYDTPMAFMESWLLVGPEDQYDNPLQDPPQETTSFEPGETLMAYAVVGGGLPEEDISVTFMGPDGSIVGPWYIDFDISWQLTTWTWWYTVQEPVGNWFLTYAINDETVSTRSFEVR